MYCIEAIIILLQIHISNKLIHVADCFMLNLAASLGTVFLMCLIVNLTKEVSMHLGPRECLQVPEASEVPVGREDGLHPA